MSGNSNYKSIIKGSALFGGTQVITILVNLIRGKIVALLLGPQGVGIMALLNNTSAMLQQFSSFGTQLSAVREISEYKESEKLEDIVFYLRILLLLLGFLGASVCFLFADLLSNYTFGNDQYISFFRILSVFIFFTTLSNGELSVLQGKRELKKVATSTILGSFTGLILGVPLYYFMGINGIVPAMIVLALSGFITNFYLNKSHSLKHNFQRTEFSDFAKRTISLGFVLMISSVIGTVTNYILIAYMNKSAGLETVGFFQSANSITNQYVGLVFTAMSLDYFPKLTANASSKIKVRKLVNEQVELVLLLITPLLSLMIIFSDVIVRVLLTEKFFTIVPLLNVMALGIYFKASSFPLGYISFAKGDRKVFFWLEGILGNVMLISLNLLGFYYGGIFGLGISFLVNYILYNGILFIITKNKYGFRYRKEVVFFMGFLFFLLMQIYLCSLIENTLWRYACSVFFLVFQIYYCFREVDKRIGIVTLIKNKLKK